MFHEKPTGKRVRTYVVSHQKDKALLWDTGDRLIAASIEKVERYLQRDTSIHNNQCSASPTVGNGDVEGSTEQLKDLMNNISNGNTNTSQLQDPMIIGKELDNIFGQVGRYFSESETISKNEFVVQIVSTNDPRGKEKIFETAKIIELDGLKL